MMVGHGALSTAGYRFGALAGTAPAALADLRAKYGDGPTQSVNEISDILTKLVYPLFTDKDWQWCTINAWLTGTPSEDEESWLGRWSSEMPTLEEVCGDHSFFNQYDAAFSDFKDKGASQQVIDWLRTKGELKHKKKIAIADKEGKENLNKAVQDTKKALNPFESPWVVGGVAAALTLLLFIKLKK
jgi:hypothetical protein